MTGRAIDDSSGMIALVFYLVAIGNRPSSGTNTTGKRMNTENPKF